MPIVSMGVCPFLKLFSFSYRKRAQKRGNLMKKLILAVIVAASFGVSGLASAQTQCRDGSYSGSSGQGTCSHHGGQAGGGR